jgi:nicotinic acid mononucleotide adenylyltransferase
MIYYNKYLKYKDKYTALKKSINSKLVVNSELQVGGSISIDEDHTIHVYFSGVFSPPNIAHELMCIDTINFFIKHNENTNIKRIILHIVPSSDFYYVQHVKSNCIKFEERFKMLEIMIESIKKKINKKKIDVQIFVNDIEQLLSYNNRSFIGTYSYLLEFSRGKKSKNIYLLYAFDIVLSLINYNPRWKNPIHLVCKFKILAYTYPYYNFNHDKLLDLFNENINDYKKRIREGFTGYNEYNEHTKDSNNLDDISNDLVDLQVNPNKFIKEHFIEIQSSNNDVANIYSYKIREVLYTYNFKLNNTYVKTQLSYLNPNIKKYISTKKLYKNGIECEGIENFEKIKLQLKK